VKRRAYRTVLDTLFHALVRYAAPIIPSRPRKSGRAASPTRMHRCTCSIWPEVDAGWLDAALGSKWPPCVRVA
jgi:isoleucyl-tRNA synthetase